MSTLALCENEVNNLIMYSLLTDHQNWFGLDDNLGPVAISIRREKVPTSALIASIAGGGGAGGGNGFLGNPNNGNAAASNNNGNSIENGSSGSSSLAPSIGEKEQFMYRIMVSFNLLEL